METKQLNTELVPAVLTETSHWSVLEEISLPGILPFAPLFPPTPAPDPPWPWQPLSSNKHHKLNSALVSDLCIFDSI